MKGKRLTLQQVENKVRQVPWIQSFKTLKFKGGKSSFLVTCKGCGIESVKLYRDLFYRMFGGKYCNGSVSKPSEVLVKNIKSVWGNKITLLDIPESSKERIRVKCNTCGSVNNTNYQNLYHNRDVCYKCGQDRAHKTRTKYQTLDDIKGISISPELKIVSFDRERKRSVYVTVKCTICGEVQKKLLGNLIHRKRGCKNFCNVTRNIVSEPEKHIRHFLKKSYPKLKVQGSVRRVIKNPATGAALELDIYIPEIKLAIEFNGTYWHSDEKILARHGITAQEYHNLKTGLCSKKGIKLIHIAESDYKKSRDSVLSYLFDLVFDRYNSYGETQ